MPCLTGSLHLFFQCANYCRERGKTVIYCILVQQTAKLKIIWNEIMLLVNSKSDKRCNRQGSTISFPKITRRLMGTLLFTGNGEPLPHSSFVRPPVTMSLGATNMPSPAFQRFLTSWPSKQASSSFPSDPTPFIAHPSCSGLALVKKQNPLECFCSYTELSGQGIHAGSP